MGLDGFFNRLKTKESRDLDSRALEQAGLLGSYLLPQSVSMKMPPPPGLKIEFRKAEDILREGADADIKNETRERLQETVNRIRQSYQLY